VPNPSATPAGDAPRLLVSLATYNEAGNLRPLVEAIRRYAPDSSILVIDDNSPDGTGRISAKTKVPTDAQGPPAHDLGPMDLSKDRSVRHELEVGEAERPVTYLVPKEDASLVRSA
jgi:hypothetical protein